MMMRYLILLNLHIVFIIPSYGEIIAGEGRIHDAAFSPDGQTIITASSIGLQTWDAETLTKQEFMHVPHGVRMLKWSPDGQYLFALRGYHGFNRPASTGIYSIHLMVKMPEFEVLYELDEQIKYIEVCNSGFNFFEHPNFINFSTDSNQVSYVTGDNRMVIISSQNGSKLFEKQYDEEITIVYFEDNNHLLVNDLEKIDIQTGEIIGEGLGENVSAMTVDGGYIIKQENIASESSTPWGTQWIAYVSSKVYNKINGGVSHEFRGKSDIISYEPTCFVNTPHRFLIFPHTQSYQILSFYSALNAWEITKYNTQRQQIINQQRSNDVNLPITTYFTNPFSHDGQFMLTVFDSTMDLNFGIGLQMNEVEQMENSRPFKDLHFPYRNINFIGNEEPKLLMMQDRNFNFLPRLPELTPFTIEYYDPTDGSIQKIDGEGPFGTTSAISNNGNKFASYVFRDRTIYFYDTSNGSIVSELELPQKNYRTLAFFDDEKKLIAAEGDIVLIIDVESGLIEKEFENQSSTSGFLDIYNLDFSDNESKMYYSLRSGDLIEYDLINDEKQLIKYYESEIFEGYQTIISIHYIREGEILVTLKDGAVYSVNPKTGQDELLFNTPINDLDDTIYSSAVTPDHKYFLIENTIWNLETNQQVGAFALDMEPIMKMDISPDGEWLAASFLDGTLATWKFDDLISEYSGIQNFDNFEN